MKLLYSNIINYNHIGFSNRYFSRFTKKRVTPTHSGLSDDEIDAKIRELQMLKAQNLQHYQPMKPPSVWSRIVDGVLHGIGWSFAGRIVDSIFGPRSLNITSSNPDNNLLNSQNNLPNSNNFTESLSDNFTPDSDSGGQGWSWITEKLFDDE